MQLAASVGDIKILEKIIDARVELHIVVINQTG